MAEASSSVGEPAVEKLDEVATVGDATAVLAKKTGSKLMVESKKKRTLMKKGAPVGSDKATEAVVEVSDGSPAKKSTAEKGKGKRKADDVFEERRGGASVLEAMLTGGEVSEEEVRITRDADIEIEGLKKISLFKQPDIKKDMKVFEAMYDLVYSDNDHENFQKLIHAQQVMLAVAAKLQMDFAFGGLVEANNLKGERVQELEAENSKAADELEAATKKAFALEKDIEELKDVRIKELELQISASRSDFSLKSVELEKSQKELEEAQCNKDAFRSQIEETKTRCEALDNDKKVLVSKMCSWLREMEGKRSLAQQNVVRAALGGVAFAEHLALTASDQMEAGFNLVVNQAIHLGMFKEGVDARATMTVGLNEKMEPHQFDEEEGDEAMGEPADDEFHSVFLDIREELEKKAVANKLV